MKIILVLVFLFPVMLLAQAAPVPPVVVAPTGVSSVFQWLVANYGMIATVLLGISESLALIFPSPSGFGGILAAIKGFLIRIGTKPPASPSAPVAS